VREHNFAGARPAFELGVPGFAVEVREPLPCRVDPDAFFVADAQAGPAKALCGPCAYREPCAAYALADSSLLGVWGGLTARERRAVRRQRLPAAS
jgi:WhiB family redox-sensing transcriptional regulator